MTKSKNGKILSNNDRLELVRVAVDFIIFKNGSNPSVDLRKSISQILQEQFPGLDHGTWYKKLTQRIKNRNRRKSPSGEHENESQDWNRNKAENGHVHEIDPLDGQDNKNTDYLDYENIDDDGDIILLDEGDSQKSEDYETYDI